VGRSLWAKISGGRGRPWGIFFGFYKTRHILLSIGAHCTALRAVILTQYRHVMDRRTDGQTDGIALASIALAMRARACAVKSQKRDPGWKPEKLVLIQSGSLHTNTIWGKGQWTSHWHINVPQNLQVPSSQHLVIFYKTSGHCMTFRKLDCGPMPNVMAALLNIGGALCSTPQTWADAHCWSTVQ